MSNIPRPEHPRPSFVRENWENLNGEWEFSMDPGASGEERGFFRKDAFDGKITVPFCPESRLSGIGNTDFMTSVWYARQITVSERQLQGHVLLHFGACDYETCVYMNGKKVGNHTGGYTSFCFDITDALKAGANRLVVHAKDDNRTELQPCGKQSRRYASHDCDYTRTTGIWQTVWLEFVPPVYLESVRLTATDLGGAVHIEAALNRYVPGVRLHVTANFEGKCAAQAEYPLDGQVTSHTFTVNPVVLWEPGKGNLYDLQYRLEVPGQKDDTVSSYFGIRRIDIDGYRVLINGKSVFQRLILDQGFYPDGIYTAPSDAALVRDIEYSMALGFNGARLHQKVFEERFLYHADRLGYLVWGEFPNWGLLIGIPEALHIFLPQWLESIRRDYNHPSIIGWCPYNETWDVFHKRQVDTNLSLIYEVTKAYDSTRPVIDTSGNYHAGKTDIYDVHDYEQNPAVYAERYEMHAKGEFFNTFPDRQRYDGKMPYFVSEYGGIKWSGGDTRADRQLSWGYGDAPKTPEEFCERYCGLTAVLLSTPNMFGFCYTQLTDVEQEQNGLYTYARERKFSDEIYTRIRKANMTLAAIEKDH